MRKTPLLKHLRRTRLSLNFRTAGATGSWCPGPVELFAYLSDLHQWGQKHFYNFVSVGHFSYVQEFIKVFLTQLHNLSSEGQLFCSLLKTAWLKPCISFLRTLTISLKLQSWSDLLIPTCWYRSPSCDVGKYTLKVGVEGQVMLSQIYSYSPKSQICLRGL